MHLLVINYSWATIPMLFPFKIVKEKCKKRMVKYREIIKIFYDKYEVPIWYCYYQYTEKVGTRLTSPVLRLSCGGSTHPDTCTVFMWQCIQPGVWCISGAGWRDVGRYLAAVSACAACCPAARPPFVVFPDPRRRQPATATNDFSYIKYASSSHRV